MIYPFEISGTLSSNYQIVFTVSKGLLLVNLLQFNSKIQHIFF